MENRKYELLLMAVIAARATSFIFSKMVLGSMGVFNLLAVRFLIAFALLVIVFFKHIIKISARDLLCGVICGAVFFLVMTSEHTALKTADSSMVSMLENCSIIFVPFFEALLLRRPPKRTELISAVIALAGVVCLTAERGGLSGGMLFGLLAAVLYAIAIIITGVVSHREGDTLAIGIIQVGTLGVLALVSTLLFETPRLPDNPSQWLMILSLAVVCTCFGYTLQPVAQRYVTAERAGLFCAISPAVAAILGAAVLNERFGALSILGLALILVSITFPYIKLPGHGRSAPRPSH